MDGRVDGEAASRSSAGTAAKGPPEDRRLGAARSEEPRADVVTDPTDSHLHSASSVEPRTSFGAHS